MFIFACLLKNKKSIYCLQAKITPVLSTPKKFVCSLLADRLLVNAVYIANLHSLPIGLPDTFEQFLYAPDRLVVVAYAIIYGIRC